MYLISFDSTVGNKVGGNRPVQMIDIFLLPLKFLTVLTIVSIHGREAYYSHKNVLDLRDVA